jgi:predicted pyridoxine 5'-phosphate oxidase superfamily flavin-nucleotide-binding protein|tara:strand:+ start:211 stop:870 length:660 start_codon:yes stop_codon:yes gene_type:complete
MSDFFSISHRQLQKEYDTTHLADRLLGSAVTEQLSDKQSAFIHRLNMFFLSTVDEFGFPTCSYKGGHAGFVRVINNNKLVFPSYDGNGMFLSMGNIESHNKVGMLFVDFERPNRLRVSGEARCIAKGPLVDSYPGADLVVEVLVRNVWVNCPRYVHPMQSLGQSPYIPDEEGIATIALWKRIDLMQDVLSDKDKTEAVSVGLITIEEYETYVAEGKLIG